ncbi:MAG: glycosyltransferase family 9 protein [Candidatus Binatia bacterium]
MKAIDHWVGLPLCACLGALTLLRRSLRPGRRSIPEQPRRIVVMKFFGLGSVVLASPMLRAIRQRYPNTTLTFLTFGSTAGLVERFGICDEIWSLRTDGLVAFATDVARQALRFSRHPVDICVDLEFFSKFSTLMGLLSRAPVRVAFQLNSFWRYSLVTHPVYYNYYRHVSDVYGDAAAAIAAPVTDKRPCRIAVEPDAVERCRERLRVAGWNGTDRLIGVNVNAGELSLERRWPGERFAAVLERLSASDGVQAVLTGAPDEADYVGGVVNLLSESAKQRIINVAGKLSFAEFIASMDLYDFFLTNDSGPVHLAYAQGVDTISLWGVGRPSFYGPLVGNHSTFYQHLPCSPCLYMFTSEVGQWCNHRADCMQAIGVDEVWNIVKAYIDTPRADRAKVRVAQGW